jgi:D-serine deaminase-like pyridoxal phosphate-dependent protein
MFGDLFQAGVGVCRREDIAVSVLATIIGQRPQLNQLLIDAGSLALSKDVSTRSFGPAGDCGYGLVASAADDAVRDTHRLRKPVGACPPFCNGNRCVSQGVM